MLRHKNIDRVCCAILALTLLVSVAFVGAAATDLIAADARMGYETRLFDPKRVHTIDIVMDDWDAFLETATSEEYTACHLVIDGESYKNVAIRGKGNTSLTSVKSYGNNRYSFKVEFDHYQTGNTYHGLDKLSLNNLIQDNTYMKDYMAYTLMNKMGVAAPLCSFVQINVGGEPWGLYLAVEGVEDSFLQRNYGRNYGELYKPDSMSFGGGRGNGRDFDMDEVAEKFGFSFDEMNGEAFSPGMSGGNMPDMGAMPQMPGGGSMPDMGTMPQMPGGGSMPDMGTMSQMPGGGSMPDMGAMPQMPGAFGLSQQTEDASSADAAAEDGRLTQPETGDGARWSDRGFGGGFGMGSNDVKLIYTDDDPASYSNIFNHAKTDASDADRARLIASLKALGNGDASVVNTEAVIRYMAVHNFLCNDDSYTGTMIHNYYLYEEDGVLEMIPWDYNLAFGGFQGGSDAGGLINRDITSLVNGGGGDRPMADWITGSEDYRAQYLAVYAQFMADVFDSGWFTAEIDRVTAMIDPYVQKDPTAFCTYEAFRKGVETLRQFCLKRAESVKLQLAGQEADVDASGLVISEMGSMGGMGGGMEFPGDAPNRTGGFMGGKEWVGRKGTRETTAAEDPPAAQAKPVQPGATDAPEANKGENMRGMEPQASNPSGWGWLGICAAILCSAILAVCLFRNKR